MPFLKIKLQLSQKHTNVLKVILSCYCTATTSTKSKFYDPSSLFVYDVLIIHIRGALQSYGQILLLFLATVPEFFLY